MDFMNQFVPNASVVVVCVILGLILKFFFEGNNRLMSGIPWMLALAGAGIMVVIQPENTDVVTMIAQGIVSGLAACGAYQIVHQQTKRKEEELFSMEQAMNEYMKTHDVNPLVETYKQLDQVEEVLKTLTKVVNGTLDKDMDTDKDNIEE